MRRSLLTILAGLALAGCGLIGPAPLPAPVEPPPVEWEPPMAPPVETPGDGSFDDIAVGMTRQQVEGMVDAPTEDEPDNPEEWDSVRYDVSTPDGPMHLFVNYKDGRVVRVRWSPVLVAGGAE